MWLCNYDWTHSEVEEVWRGVFSISFKGGIVKNTHGRGSFFSLSLSSFSEFEEKLESTNVSAEIQLSSLYLPDGFQFWKEKGRKKIKYK